MLSLDVLQSDHVRLRPLEERDADLVHHWRSHPASLQYDHPGALIPESPEHAQRWVKHLVEDRRTLAFVIEVLPELTPVGLCDFSQIDQRNRNAELAIYIGDPQHQGQGYGAAALHLLLALGFLELNLHRIHLEVMAFNDRALKTFRKLGFREEGRCRDMIFRMGQYHDAVLMSMLAVDYRAGQVHHVEASGTLDGVVS